MSDTPRTDKEAWRFRRMTVGGTEAAIDYARELERALVQCVSVVKMWHGADVFDIYYNHSPEMKLIRDAIGDVTHTLQAEEMGSERKVALWKRYCAKRDT